METTESNLSLPGRQWLPDAPGPWPAIVLVHGWLGNETVIWTFASTAPPGTALFSPRGVHVAGPEGFGWFREHAEEAEVLEGIQALDAYVSDLPRHFPIDRKRVTLMGFSQGAAACAALWLHNPGNELAHCRLSDGGGLCFVGNKGIILALAGTVSIRDCVIEGSAGWGIYKDNDPPAPTVNVGANVTFRNNALGDVSP